MLGAGAALGAAWCAARGWLTPAVLFVAMNLVIATIAVATRLMPAAPGGDDDDEAAGERRGRRLLRAPSLAVDRLLRSSFSFSSRLGLAAGHDAPAHVLLQPRVVDDRAPEDEPSLQPAMDGAETDQPEAAHELEESPRIGRSRSEAAAEAAPSSSRRRPRATAEARDGEAEEAAVVEVDERADDFIRRFREQLRLQRLDSMLRYRDALRRTGTA